MSDLIDRQAVIDLLKQMRKDGDMVPWEGKDVFARIRKLPTIQPEEAQLSCGDTTSDLISRQAVKYLDLFTKTYCRDESATDDLVFRCSDCEFELRPSGKCLVKCMARKLCPDYKDFGSMGDL